MTIGDDVIKQSYPACWFEFTGEYLCDENTTWTRKGLSYILMPCSLNEVFIFKDRSIRGPLPLIYFICDDIIRYNKLLEICS